MSRKLGDSCKSFNQINGSHLNKSKSKQTYSFSKSSRFSTPRPVIENLSYTKQVIQKPRGGTAIGYGKRFSFEKCAPDTPSPNKYPIKAFSQKSKEQKKGFSFSLSRQNLNFGCYISKQTLKTPLLTKYQTSKDCIQVKAPKFTIRKKTSVSEKLLSVEPQNNNPGPGQYENPQSHQNLFATKYSLISYGVNKSSKFRSNTTISPGPGKYLVEKSDSLNKSLNSRHKNSNNIKFGVTKKQNEFQRGARISFYKPGPGSYRLPSQFGYYENNKNNVKFFN